jgi:hypothetical protein
MAVFCSVPAIFPQLDFELPASENKWKIIYDYGIFELSCIWKTSLRKYNFYAHRSSFLSCVSMGVQWALTHQVMGLAVNALAGGNQQL